MSETVLQVAERFGIPADKLEDALNHKGVCQALVIGREQPDLAPEKIVAMLDLPSCDPDGLDVDRVIMEVEKEREIATNSEGEFIEGRLGHALVRGQMERQKKIADRRYQVVCEAHKLICEGNADRAEQVLGQEIHQTIEQQGDET